MSDVIDLTAAERRMKGAVDSVRSNFATIRTGRANPTLLDRIEVEVYGSRMPLRSVANVIRLARSMAEEGRVSVRNVRRDEMRDVHELRKEGEISQDDEHRAEEELQELTNGYIQRIDAILADKEAELLEV